MKKTKFTEEQILAILKEQENGLKVAEICRKHGIVDQTFYCRLDGFQRQLNSIEKKLENVATQDDLKRFVTKNDLNKKFDVLFKHFGIDLNLLTEE